MPIFLPFASLLAICFVKWHQAKSFQRSQSGELLKAPKSAIRNVSMRNDDVKKNDDAMKMKM